MPVETTTRPGSPGSAYASGASSSTMTSPSGVGMHAASQMAEAIERARRHSILAAVSSAPPRRRPARSATGGSAGSLTCAVRADQWPRSARNGTPIRPVIASSPREMVVATPRTSAEAVSSQVARRGSQRSESGRALNGAITDSSSGR